MGRLEGKVALITGGARGIGAATAELFVEHGAFVVISDILNDEGQLLAERLGERVIYHTLDVASEAEWKVLTDYIRDRLGHLDVLFNNAGITGIDGEYGPQDPEHMSIEDWHAVHAINLDGVFLGCKYGIGLMKSKGGSIINMSSRSGMVGIPMCAAYASAKAAVRNHTKSVALYCASHGYNIRCNSLHPGAILTPIWAPMFGDTPEEQATAIEMMSKDIPLGRMGEPIDVANATLFLASDESKYMTGSEITIDGGILAGSSAAPHQKED